MNRSIALTALAFSLALVARPAAARDFVMDQAGMFSASTVSSLNQRIGNFNAQTGKEIVVMTVPSLGGSTLAGAAQSAFSQQRVNGVLVYVARDDRRDIIVPDRAGVQAGWFTPDVLRSIRTTMEAQFHSEDYDAGITAAVGAILNVYRAHAGSLGQTGAAPAGASMTKPASTTGGFHLSMFWWIVVIVVGYLILRSVLRSLSGPRYGPPGAPGVSGPPAGGYGAQGYGPGYGGYGGGGSFWSGLLGGLGGAWLGNEMFGQRGGAIGPADAGQAAAPDAGGGWGAGNDGGGWQSDAGQADMGGASGGDWSGGGFGGGDGGGFSGGDFGGGGGDSGGGW